MGDVVIKVKDELEAPPVSEPVHSWAPRTSAPSRRTMGLAGRDLARTLMTWVVIVALAIDALAILIEPVELLRHGAPARAAIAAVFDSMGMSVLFAATAAVPIAAVYSLVRFVGALPPPWRYAWPAIHVALAWLVVTVVAPHPFAAEVTRAQGQRILWGLLAAFFIAATLVARIERTVYRVPPALMLAVLMLGLSDLLPPSIHREPRDLVWCCLVVAASALVYPVRREIKAMGHVAVARGFLAFVLGSVALSWSAHLVSPSYRVYARDYGSFSERLGRFARELVDLDDDGFSSLFGGRDCDDLDPGRNPAMPEVDQQDRNCNGLVRPANPTPAQRGLSPAAGAPDAVEGEIDRVVLVTFDCFRSDVMSPEVTPNLVALAARGLNLTKLYAAGSRTALALPLMVRGAYGGRPMASVLHDAGITSTVVFAYTHNTLDDNVLAGFDVIRRPLKGDKRYRAKEVTDLVLEDLRDPAHARRHLVWAHYFDAHGPRTARVLPPDLPRFAPLAGEDSDSALYLAELAYDDRELARLLEGVEATGDPRKTVIIVTADHGEGFGAHNVYEHGMSAFEEIVHVPGVVVAPGLAAGRYDHVLSHRDILATVLGAFGLVASNPRSEELGRSWLRLREAPGVPLHEFVITYTASAHVFSWGDAPMVVRTDDESKYAVDYRSGIERLYHLRSRERETRDVAPMFGDEVARDRHDVEVYRDLDRPPP